MKKTLSVLCMLAVAAAANAQAKKTPAKQTAKPAKLESGFTKLPHAVEYKIVKDVPGTKIPKMGDYIAIHLSYKVDDSVMFSTRQVLKDQPAEIVLQPSTQVGDVSVAFPYMSEGDSAIMRVSVDSVLKVAPQPQPWMKAGVNQYIMYSVVMATVKSAEEKQAEASKAADAQKTIDDKILQDYFAKNNIKPIKTASGLYYTIERMGTGAMPQQGDTVVANYTGKTLDGKPFDSNVDPQFQHVEPFKFMLGMHNVIAGWDEGFGLMKKGTKGTLYIPSHLAYGANSPDPSRIPNNGVLVFDVELVNVNSTMSANKK